MSSSGLSSCANLCSVSGLVRREKGLTTQIRAQREDIRDTLKRAAAAEHELDTQMTMTVPDEYEGASLASGGSNGWCATAGSSSSNNLLSSEGSSRQRMPSPKTSHHNLLRSTGFRVSMSSTENGAKLPIPGHSPAFPQGMRKHPYQSAPY
eukprot:Clim_evm15s6 gene=Clim_evmTU15s6